MQARHQMSSQAQDELPDLGRVCDFCGDRVAAVRRVALDAEYDRLQKAHHEQYSCSTCFDLKEERRIGMARR